MEEVKIRENPYRFICDHYEKVYKHIGRKVFSVLSLVIPSLIIPNIPHKTSREIKSSINFLLISPPGTAKSSLCETFGKLAFNSFPFESITDSKLYSVLSEKDYVSLVIGDIFKVFSDKLLTKTLENVLGDEQKLSRFTQRTDDSEKKIKAVAFLAGTPDSLTSVIRDGMIFRTSVCLVFYDADEHNEIGEYVSDGAFKETKENDEEEKIIKYYKELLNIQLGINKEIKPIKSYIVNEEYKKRLLDAWKPLVRPITKKTKFAFIRELHNGMRYMCSHSFLNVFNRKIQNNKLIIEEDDLKVAINLMKKEISTKHKILTCNRIVSEERLRTLRDLSDWVEKYEERKKQKVGKEAENIIGSLIE